MRTKSGRFCSCPAEFFDRALGPLDQSKPLTLCELGLTYNSYVINSSARGIQLKHDNLKSYLMIGGIVLKLSKSLKSILHLDRT